MLGRCVFLSITVKLQLTRVNHSINPAQCQLFNVHVLLHLSSTLCYTIAQGLSAPVDARYAALPVLTKDDLRNHSCRGFVGAGCDASAALQNGAAELLTTSATTAERVTNLWHQLGGTPRNALRGRHMLTPLTSPPARIAKRYLPARVRWASVRMLPICRGQNAPMAASSF